MPYVLKHVEILGFQGSRNISVALWPDVNFLIGRNGTGKTSFVRLVHACLSLDLEEIAQTSFDAITIRFTDTENDKTPTLRIHRDRLRSAYLEISFRTTGSQKFTKYFVDDDGIPRPRIVDRAVFTEFFGPKTSISDNARPLSDLRRTLRRQLQFSWLPLLRSRAVNRRADYISSSDMIDEPINRKIRELISQITQYLASLDSRVSASNRRFQRDVFVAYLAPGLFDIHSMKSLDLDQERQQLLKMLNEMEFPLEDLAENIEQFFKAVNLTQTSVEPGLPTLPVHDVVNIVTGNALHRIVRSFGKYTQEKETTLYPQVQFINLLNELLYHKRAHFDESNVLSVSSHLVGNDNEEGPPEKMDIFNLSSGEKQLLVILSETLLQQNRRYIFIADEPELSLHVEWQERLVRTIREMNSNVQILFATHSPDIVSVYQDRVIDFERV